MSSETRGPRPGRIPPHIQDEVEDRRKQRLRRELLGPWYRRPPAVGAMAGVVALIVGLVLGQLLAGDGSAAAADEADSVLADLQQAALIWDSGGPQTPPVQEARTALGEGATESVTANLAGWRQAYEQLLVPLEDTTLDSEAADGARRLAVAAVQRYVDAVEALGAAATVEGPARDVLLTEVDRLHTRAQEVAASARALVASLSGDAPAPEPIPSLPALPAPEGVATAPQPGASGTPTGAPTESGTVESPPASEPAPAES